MLFSTFDQNGRSRVRIPTPVDKNITKSALCGLQGELVYLQLSSNYALIAATKLALQGKGFIAMSIAIAFPSSTTTSQL